MPVPSPSLFTSSYGSRNDASPDQLSFGDPVENLDRVSGVGTSHPQSSLPLSTLPDEIGASHTHSFALGLVGAQDMELKIGSWEFQ